MNTVLEITHGNYNIQVIRYTGADVTKEFESYKSEGRTLSMLSIRAHFSEQNPQNVRRTFPALYGACIHHGRDLRGIASSAYPNNKKQFSFFSGTFFISKQE